MLLSHVLRQDPGCWQGYTGPTLRTSAEEKTQREMTWEGKRSYSEGGQEELAYT